ncbi:hypothetical protein K1X84_08700 [bacterium]|nr:hypothetical protein [bacterium]
MNKFIWIILLATAVGQVFAQIVPFNERDDKYRLLGLKRAKEAYEAAKADYDRQKQLFDKAMVSAQELESARRNFADAEVNYQQSLLAVLFEQQFVSVTKAVKYQGSNSQKRVRVELTNASGGGGEFMKLVNLDDKLFQSLQPDFINNVYVSLLNSEGAIVSQPYETKIAELQYGKPVSVDFILLQDLDAVTVNIIYGNGSSRSMKIYLQKDASENKVLVQSEQFSQEADLGGTAQFDFSLELFSGKDNTFKLEVVNLPPEITRYFTDPASEAKLSQFKFTESANTRKASLRIFLPDRPTEAVGIDRSIPFYVLVIPQEKLASVNDWKQRNWTREEIEKLNVGFVKLELIPRGNAKLLVRAPKLYYSALTGETVEATVDVKNEGSRRLDNIKAELDMPLNWKKEITPLVIPSLDIGEEKSFHFQFIPPADVAVGKYEIRVRTSSVSENQPVNGEDKTITIEMLPQANVLGTLLIVALILGVVGGIVWFGIKLTRK